MVKYFNKHANGHFTLRPTRTIIVDGRPIDKPPITFLFVDNVVDTDRMAEPEEAERLMDAWIEKHPRQARIHKIPSEAEIKKVTAVIKKVEKAKKKAVAEVMEKHEDAVGIIEKQGDFDAFVAKAKEQKLVQGMRGTGQ